jgi:hypothetical protein
MQLSQYLNATWEKMPRIQIRRDVQLGELVGNGLELKCRVEITSKTAQGLLTVRQFDIWIGESLPAGEYKLVIPGETLLMQYSHGLWQEIPGKKIPVQEIPVHKPAMEQRSVA